MGETTVNITKHERKISQGKVHPNVFLDKGKGPAKSVPVVPNSAQKATEEVCLRLRVCVVCMLYV